MSNFQSTKVLELGSCAFRQPKAGHSHCRFIHGYRLTAKFWFGTNVLDKHNWVVDFGALKGLKNKLHDQFDHTTCIAADDPTLPIFEDLVKADACDLRIMPNGTGIERIAEWCFETSDHYVNALTKGRCWVDRVEVWEHENNSAAYNRPMELEGISSSAARGQQELDLRLDNGEPLEDNKNKLVSAEIEAEEIATASDEKQDKNEGIKTVHPGGDPKQHKTTNTWVDPSKAKATNSWMF